MNELFVLHLDREILTTEKWQKLLGNSPYRRISKKVFMKRGHASCACSYLPAHIQKRVTIVRYVPENSKTPKSLTALENP